MRNDSELYAKCCGTTFVGPDPEASHVEYHNYQFSKGRRSEEISVQGVEVQIDDPDDALGMPIYEGNVSEAGSRLTPGTYTGRLIGGEYAVVVTVGEDSTTYKIVR